MAAGPGPLAFAAAGGLAAGGLATWLLLRQRRPQMGPSGGLLVHGTDFQGKPSSYLRSGRKGVVGLLAYDIAESMTEEEYDEWLFGRHYHDLLANPHLQKIELLCVDEKREVRLSSGKVVKNDVKFGRMAELHFASFKAYEEYVSWFQANAIPPPRTPEGKSVFRFYLLSESEAITRPPPAAPSAPSAPKPVRTAGRKAVLVIGSTGIIGRELVGMLKQRGDVLVIEASRNVSGEHSFPLDLTDEKAVRNLDKVLPDGVDHVVVCTGTSIFGPLESFNDGKWVFNLIGKLAAVSRLVVMLANREELKLLRDSGSITVTTGQAAGVANRMWPGLATNNAGLDAFVRCAGLRPPRNLRLNAVSPCLVTETAKNAGLPLEGTVAAADAAAKYLPLIFGEDSGSVVLAGEQTVFEKSHQVKKEAPQPASKI